MRGTFNYSVATNDTIRFTGAGIAINGGSLLLNVAGGGSVQFINDASAGSASLNTGSGGTLTFDDTASAGNATIQNTELTEFLGRDGWQRYHFQLARRRAFHRQQRRECHHYNRPGDH